MGYISETIKGRKLILSIDIGWGCRFAISWCNLNLTFDLAVVTFNFKKSCESSILEAIRYRMLILGREIGWGVGVQHPNVTLVY